MTRQPPPQPATVLQNGETIVNVHGAPCLPKRVEDSLISISRRLYLIAYGLSRKQVESGQVAWPETADLADAHHLIEAIQDKICGNADLLSLDGHGLEHLSNSELRVHLAYYACAGVTPLVGAILAALRRRRVTLQQLLHILITEAYTAFLSGVIPEVRTTGEVPRPVFARPCPPHAPMAPPLTA